VASATARTAPSTRGVGLCRARRDAGDLAHVLKGGGLDLSAVALGLKPSRVVSCGTWGHDRQSARRPRRRDPAVAYSRNFDDGGAEHLAATPRSRDHRARCTPRPSDAGGEGGPRDPAIWSSSLGDDTDVSAWMRALQVDRGRMRCPPACAFFHGESGLHGSGRRRRADEDATSRRRFDAMSIGAKGRSEALVRVTPACRWRLCWSRRGRRLRRRAGGTRMSRLAHEHCPRWRPSE